MLAVFEGERRIGCVCERLGAGLLRRTGQNQL